MPSIVRASRKPGTWWWRGRTALLLLESCGGQGGKLILRDAPTCHKRAARVSEVVLIAQHQSESGQFGLGQLAMPVDVPTSRLLALS